MITGCPKCKGTNIATIERVLGTCYGTFDEGMWFSDDETEMDWDTSESLYYECQDCFHTFPIDCPAADHVQAGINALLEARRCFQAAGSKKTLERVKLAMSSAKGALRHARLAPYREKRQAETARPMADAPNKGGPNMAFIDKDDL